MIVVLGSSQETLSTHVYDALRERGIEAVFIEQSDLPNTVKLTLEARGNVAEGYFLTKSGRVDFQDITAMYARPGVGYFEVYGDYNQEEIEFVNITLSLVITWITEYGNFLTVNRPSASRSNGSKPYQINLLKRFGFRIPRTLVSNDPATILEFYESCNRQIIYKSVSSIRSIVKKMTSEDVERIETVRRCPVQVQEYIEGEDIRVHVVGEACFASRILSQESDYRYDRSNTMEPFMLPPAVHEQCVAAARGLGLYLTGIDLRRTPDGEFYCFEANPSPVFTYYENRTDFGDGKKPITEAVCNLLKKGRDAQGAENGAPA